MERIPQMELDVKNAIIEHQGKDFFYRYLSKKCHNIDKLKKERNIEQYDDNLRILALLDVIENKYNRKESLVMTSLVITELAFDILKDKI